MSTQQFKLDAARAALDYLPEAGVVGLGSGSTAKLFIDELGKLVAAGRQLVGVPTSEDSRAQAIALGIPLLDDAGPWQIDVCVDGADEVNDQLDVIKGGGGCHTREKIINYASAMNIIIVDESKLSQRLGEKWAVPVETLQFAHLTTKAALEALGPAALRLKNGAPWVTDSGNLIYDVSVGPIDDCPGLDAQLKRLPGVVETGLFCARADVVLVAGSAGLKRISKARG